MYIYSDQRREEDPHALPNIEVFQNSTYGTMVDEETGEPVPQGWYWWSCFAGCLPDGDPIGPFVSAKEAEEDVQAVIG